MTKVCIVCNKEFTRPIAKCCSVKCSRINDLKKKRERSKEYRIEHPEVTKRFHEKQKLPEVKERYRISRKHKYLTVPGYAERCRANARNYLKRLSPEKRKELSIKQAIQHKNNPRKEQRAKWKKAYVKRKLKTDKVFHLRYRITRRLSKKSILYHGKKLEDILGYPMVELKKHLETQFTPEMSWDNYGKYWEIDHIVPLSWFKTEEQILFKGWSIKNLQPLERTINIEKSNKFVGNPKTNYPVIYL